MIYFITARDVGMVKIGHAKDPQARIVAVQTHSPVALTLERVREGGRDEEVALHKLFSADRVRGEWFNITPEIEALMSGLPTHKWRHRGWHHAARRGQKAQATADTLLETRDAAA